MNKVSTVRTNTSFRGNYMVKGSNDALDEVCWYLRKKLASPTCGMDFLDIRLNSEPKSPVKRLFAPPIENVKKVDDSKNTYIVTPSNRLKRHTETDLDTEEKSFSLADSLLAGRGWRDRDRIKPIEDVDGLDLIITGNDKHPVEKSLMQILSESISSKFGGRTINETQRIEGDNTAEISHNISKGLPITNLRQNIVRDYLGFKFLEIPILKAPEVIEKLQKGTFDVRTGLSLQG